MRRVRLTAVGLGLAAIAAFARCGENPPPRPATLVLVTVDTLRRDHVSAYTRPGEAPRARTPRIDALAAQGLRFTDARTPVPLTLPAHTSMLSGLPPAVHNVRSNSASRVARRSARRWSLLPEALTDAGWCCGAFVSAGPLVARYGLSSGFATYDDGGLDDRTGGGYAERRGRDTVERALAWVRAAPQGHRVFLWVHLFEPHDPHPADYRGDVEEADAAVGLLLDGLEAAGRGDASIVLTADHGEALGEDGEPTHGFLLGESVLRVPLLLRARDVSPGVRHDPADVADVAPTLAALAGVPFSSGAASPEGTAGVGAGLDLRAGPTPPDRPRVAEGLHAWHQHRWSQLSAAVVAGWKLEDRGEAASRPRRLSRVGDDLRADDPVAVPAEGRPEAQAPAAALRAYRASESRARDPGGAAPGGYGAGGPVDPFLDPRENARHPDPYEAIEDVTRLGSAATAVLAPPHPERLRAARGVLDALGRRDPGNPAVAFWLARLDRTENRPADALTGFRRALTLGRQDADTLLLAMRSAMAANDPREALALRIGWRDVAPDDPRIVAVEAEAYGRLGEGAKAREAQARADALTKAKAAEAPAQGCR